MMWDVLSREFDEPGLWLLLSAPPVNRKKHLIDFNDELSQGDKGWVINRGRRERRQCLNQADDRFDLDATLSRETTEFSQVKASSSVTFDELMCNEILQGGAEFCPVPSPIRSDLLLLESAEALFEEVYDVLT